MRALPLLLVACGPSGPDYWEEVSQAPVITGLYPESVGSVTGGQVVQLVGARLGSARTVVFGGRNATILQAEEGAISVMIPSYTPGGGTVDVAVVTDDGRDTLEGWFTYDAPGAAFAANEHASVSLMRYDCPIEGWGTTVQGFRDAIFWCGGELGYASSLAWVGSTSQRGMAGDLQETVELSSLPELGHFHLLGPGDDRPLPPALSYTGHSPEDRISITAERDTSYDLAFVQDRFAMVEAWYSWAGSIDDWSGPQGVLYLDDTCVLLEDVNVTPGATAQSFGLDQAVGDAVAMTIGFSWSEAFEDGSSDTVSVVTGTADIVASEGGATAAHAGAVLQYDDFSGYYFGRSLGGYEGLSNLLPDGDGRTVSYDVSMQRLDEVTELGTIGGFPELVLGEPANLLKGKRVFDRSEDLMLEWEPVTSAEDPLILGIDLRVLDYDIEDPNAVTEVWRLVARADPSVGRFVIPADQLAALPEAPNAFDRNYDQVGYWAELTVALHQLRKLPLEGSTEAAPKDLVVDWMHVVNAPVTLR